MKPLSFLGVDGPRVIGPGHPVYSIAEVGSNFDHDLDRAKHLALLAKQAGADAYKIQNFLAEKIVSEAGFRNHQVAFQAAWKESVVKTYRKAEFPRAWLRELSDYCKSIHIDFFSAPYDTQAVDMLEEINVPLYKIGSGEIDNLEFLSYVAKTGKPIIVATGSATMEEVDRAVRTIREAGNDQIALLQCVTNYPSPIADANLLAMNAMGERFDVVVGYSDHTIGVVGHGDDPLNGLTVPLGSVARGGLIIEKHFTDDPTRKGPDHPFAIDIETFRSMNQGIRAMELALGHGRKEVMPSEKETVVIQRRGAFACRNIKAGEILSRDMMEFLRPAKGLRPPEAQARVGRKVLRDIPVGEPITAYDIA